MASKASAYRPAVPWEQRDERRCHAQVVRGPLRGSARSPVDAALVEISIYGCRIACDLAHDADESISLRLDGSLPISAKVVWSRDGMIGCRFDDPIGRPLLRSLTIRPA